LVGKYASKMSGGGNLRGVPTRDSDPLEAFRELIERRKRSNKRTVRLRLFPNRYLTMRRGRHSSIESYHLRKGMRSTRDTTTNIRGFLVLMLVRLLIRMTRLGTPSSSNWI